MLHIPLITATARTSLYGSSSRSFLFMQQLHYRIIELETDGSQAEDKTDTRALSGVLHTIEYVEDTLDDPTTVTISMTDRVSGVDITLLTLSSQTASDLFYLRTPQHDNTGSALSSYTLRNLDGKIRVVIAGGGVSKTGKIIIGYVPAR